MTLVEYYNSSIIALQNGSLIQASTGVLETAFQGMWAYLAIFAVICILIFIKTKNVGLVGVVSGILGSLLIYLGKFPPFFQIVPVAIMSVSFGLTVYLFYTERNTG